MLTNANSNLPLLSETIQAGIVQSSICVSAFFRAQRARVSLWISETCLAHYESLGGCNEKATAVRAVLGWRWR